MFRLSRKVLAMLGAAVLAACSSVSKAFTPDPGKPLVIVVCGLWETPGASRLDCLAEALRQRGYEVRQYAFDQVKPWDGDRPVMAIGYSYGGATLCAYSCAGCRIDTLILIDPTQQGAIWNQGKPLRIGRVGEVQSYMTYDSFPRASTQIIDSTGNEYSAIPVHSANHWTIVDAVQGKIITLFDTL